jgi:tetratricopeptide (TPR) repeat protein
VASGEAYYVTGRYYDGMHDHARALDAYRKAVAADSRNVEAHNALGVVLARLGQYEAAEAALRRGLVLDPSRGHVRSNLGRVLMLGGRTREAIVELQAAVSLDPSDATARGNLQQAIVASGGVPSAPSSASVEARVPVDPDRAQDASKTVAPGHRLALHWEASDRPTVSAWPVQADSKLPAPAHLATAAAPSPAQLEVVNGNGMAGAAAERRRLLAAHGMPTHRMANKRPYDQQQTVVQYRIGHEAAAQRLAHLLPSGTEVLAVPALRTDVRVVLGRDWTRLVGCVQQATCRAEGRVAVAHEVR